MYEQFLADPSSVDPAWHDFFADYKPTQRAAGNGGVAASSSGTTTTTTTRAVENGQAQAAKPAPAPQQAAPAAKAAVKAPAPKAAAPRKPGPHQPAKAAPVNPAEGEEQKQLRGASAAIAKNMELSLAVPTATSVRAVPAKLLADNRIV